MSSQWSHSIENGFKRLKNVGFFFVCMELTSVKYISNNQIINAYMEFKFDLSVWTSVLIKTYVVERYKNSFS